MHNLSAEDVLEGDLRHGEPQPQGWGHTELFAANYQFKIVIFYLSSGLPFAAYAAAAGLFWNKASLGVFD